MDKAVVYPPPFIARNGKHESLTEVVIFCSPSNIAPLDSLLHQIAVANHPKKTQHTGAPTRVDIEREKLLTETAVDLTPPTILTTNLADSQLQSQCEAGDQWTCRKRRITIVNDEGNSPDSLFSVKSLNPSEIVNAFVAFDKTRNIDCFKRWKAMKKAESSRKNATSSK
jgi:hypothetical protein